MALGFRLTGTAVPALTGLAGLLAQRNYTRLPVLPSAPDGSPPCGHVTVVVPARNESVRIGALLRSLGALQYADYDVVVVDDGSSDATGDRARTAGARVVRIEGPEPGWTGKAYACWVGAEVSQGDWILFTDADTIHAPGSLSAAVGYASDRGLQFLSLLTRQQCGTLPERLLLPYAYALYFVGAMDADGWGRSQVANGQYMLFRREAYALCGGHEAVRGSIIEDVALARVARRKGIPVGLLRGEAYVEVRMYAGLRSLWEGLSKNAVRFLAVKPLTGSLTAVAGLILASALPAAVRAPSRARRIVTLGMPIAALLPWYRRFGTPWHVLLYPLAAAVFQMLALDSTRRTLRPGHTRWKGRSY